MVLFKLLIFTLTFYKFIVDLDARDPCKIGQRINPRGNGCEPCPPDNFQDEPNYYQRCKPCTTCERKLGSVVKEECTTVTDRKCQCSGESVPWDSNSSSCKCAIGFVLNNGRCSKCEDGYFTAYNSLCQKWKECKCGVKKNGTRSSDVICNVELQGCSMHPSNTYITTSPTSNKMISLITRLTSQHPHEGAHTQRTRTTTTAAAPGHTVTYIGTGMALIILGIIGLLVLTAVTCKLHITPPPLTKENDSLCRRPVEESGEGSLFSLKVNPGEH